MVGRGSERDRGGRVEGAGRMKAEVREEGETDGWRGLGARERGREKKRGEEKKGERS